MLATMVKRLTLDLLVFMCRFILGGQDLADRLLNDEVLMTNKSAVAGLNDIKLLLEYMDIFQITDKV